MKSTLIRGLRWSERYTKTDMVYLVGQSGWLLVGQVVIFIFSFGLAWLFANFMDPAIYGTYKFAVTVATLASITTLTGMGTAVAKALAHGEPVDLSSIMRTKLRFGTIGALATAGLAVYYLLRDDTTLFFLFFTVALFVPFFDSFADFQYVLQGKQAFSQQTKYRIYQRCFVTAATAGTLLLWPNLVTITSVYFGSLAISSYLLWHNVVRQHSAVTMPAAVRKSITHYGYKISIMNIFYIGAGHVDKVLLYHFLGPAQLAIYFFTIALPGELNGVISNLNTVVFPRLVGKSSKHFKLSLLRKIGVYFLLLIIPVTGYVFAAPWLFATFFPKYLEAVPLTQLFAGTLLFTPFSVITHYFLASQHERALAVLAVATPGSLIVAMIILIPLFGIVGAILAVYIKLTVDTLLNLWFFTRDLRHPSP